MVSAYNSDHLEKKERIKLGSFYTPEKLVKKVYSYVMPYIKKNKEKTVIFDSAAGGGAFILGLEEVDYRVADWDEKAFKSLKNNFKNSKVFYTNSLKNVKRSKYDIEQDNFLIIVGNPPYNDTTSKYKNGEKGDNICDDDLFDRDLGRSFLRSYNKLNADVVCVLHPLSYLIKKTNFRRLKDFKDNYKLVNGTIFSSSLFSETSSTEFPIMIGLYERDKDGMTFNDIKNFNFSVLESQKKFKLSDYETIDDFIRKYPPRKNDMQESPIDLYYYTLRDINSLKRNKSFMDEKHYNGIVVTVENFYQYAYLYAFKKLFNPEKSWLYGNLTPLVNKNKLKKNKKKYVEYAIQDNTTLKSLERNTIKEITDYYDLSLNNLTPISELESFIKDELNLLTK